MKAYVYVSLKKSVLDPQGKTIQGALKKMGYKTVSDIRQGKYFEIQLENGLEQSEAKAEGGTHCPRSSDQSGDRRISLLV